MRTKLQTGRVARPLPARASEGDVGASPLWGRLGLAPYLLLVDALALSLAGMVQASGPHLGGVVLSLTVFALSGSYRSRLHLSVLDDLPALVSAIAVAMALDLALGREAPDVRDLGLGFAGLVAAVTAGRLVAFSLVRQARIRGWVNHCTVIVGAGTVGDRLASALLERREYGLRPTGFIDSAPAAAELLPVPVLGGYADLPAIVKRYGVTHAIVAYDDATADLLDLRDTCARLRVRVFVVPRLADLHILGRYTDSIWGIPVAPVRRAPSQSPMWMLKRVVDVVVAGSALLFLAPLLLLCATAVRLEGGPGVIFRQERVGLHGRRFDLLKFRSLKPASDTESATQWNIRHDARLGPVGRFLRTTSVDELPQLWNILRGDMSLVGPRPERPHFVRQFSEHIPGYPSRHRVPAGLTGWAQAHGLRGDTSIEDRARFDNFYIENWSPWMDVKIIVKTVSQVLRRQGG